MSSKAAVEALYYEEKSIGLWMKKSKKHYIWKLSLEGDVHCIEFLDSILSGKKKIVKDGLTIFERQLFGVPFQYPFNIGKHSLNIAMHGDKYELRVDGMSFSHMYATKKAQGAFKQQKTSGSMGAYGDDIYASKRPTENFNKDSGPSSDPFGWDSNKPASRKTMPQKDLSHDDPWGEVKESELAAKQEAKKSGFDAGSQPKSFFGEEKKEEDPFAFGEEEGEKKDEFAFDDFEAKPEPAKALEDVFEADKAFDPFDGPATGAPSAPAQESLEGVVFAEEKIQETPQVDPFAQPLTQVDPFAQPQTTSIPPQNDPFASAPVPAPVTTAPTSASVFQTSAPIAPPTNTFTPTPSASASAAPAKPEGVEDREKSLVNLGNLGAPPKQADDFGFPAASSQFGGFDQKPTSDFSFTPTPAAAAPSEPKKEDWLEF